MGRISIKFSIGVYIKRHQACFGLVHVDIACASPDTVVRYHRYI